MHTPHDNLQHRHASQLLVLCASLHAAHSYMKQCMGGPTPAEYEALLAERELLKKELSDARMQIEELQLKVCHQHEQH